jgi:ornithine--oxo-acid transaminase
MHRPGVTADRPDAPGQSFDLSALQYRQFVNPLWLDLLSEIGLLREFVAGEGAYLIDGEGNRFLDLVAGFGAAALGHAHPALCRALAAAAQDPAPGIVPWGISPQTGQLAARLCQLAGAQLTKVYFASGGAEAVDAALKFAAAATGRDRFLVFEGGFHGLTLAATGLSGGVWSEPFPRIWPTVIRVPVGDAAAVRAAMADNAPAAIVLEIIQGSGPHAWDAAALAQVSKAAKAAGTLVIVDEIVTGLGRTGEWFAFSDAAAAFEPDMVVLSKVLTGGLVPLSAVLMREEIFHSVFSGRARAKIHGSTFSSARLGMACGLAVLDIIEQDDVLANVRSTGTRMMEGLHSLISRGLVAGVLGRGLLLGVDVANGDLQARASAASNACLGLMARGVLTGIAGHDPGLLRLTPPFVLKDDDVCLFLDALEDTLLEMSAPTS